MTRKNAWSKKTGANMTDVNTTGAKMIRKKNWP